ncbi:MAG: hypothetical protein ACM3Q4_16655 [Acidobacteriota bacterium]
MNPRKKTTPKQCTTCRQVFRHMCDTLGADMNSPECQAMRAHVSQCANCSAYLASLQKTVQLYASYPLPPLPARATRDLLQSIKSGRKHS